MNYWFYHEYLDEARRFRIHRIEADTEQQARKQHRQACDFAWVTQHVEPSVSSLYAKTDTGPRTLAPGHRPGETYRTVVDATEPPTYIRQLLNGVKANVATEL